MSETQLDRVSAWRKAHRRRLSIVGLSGIEQHLVLVLDMLAIRDLSHLVRGESRPDVGWAVRDDGRPLTRRELAAHLRLAPGQEGLRELTAAIDGLVELGHIVVADDGAIGSVAWSDLQETPDAQRKREARAGRREDSPPAPAAPRAPAGSQPADEPRTPPGLSADSPPQRTEDRGQNRSDDDAGASGREQTLGRRIALTRQSMGFGIALVATRTKIPASTLRAIEADEAEPTRDELAALAKALGDPSLASAPITDREPNVAAIAVDALHEARCELGADEPRPQICGDLVRAAHAPAAQVPEGMTLAACWPIVIRRAKEEARRNAEDGRGRRDLEFLTLHHLAEPGRWRRYIGNSDLDVRRPPGGARSNPRRGLKGPPPPENEDLAVEVERMA